MTTSFPDHPPVDWSIIADPDHELLCWAVYAPGQSRPVVWGLRSREAAVRWAWRMSEKGARTARQLGGVVSRGGG